MKESRCKGRFCSIKGFTLIELLVVVLIIAVITSIALPAYNRAILKSRFKSVMPLAKAVNQGQEIYYLTEGQYADKLKDLDVQATKANSNTVTTENGITVTTSGDDDEYDYVLATRNGMDNNYIMYQKHSPKFASNIHCEAKDGDDMANWLCRVMGGQEIGGSQTEGYVTYLLAGNVGDDKLPTSMAKLKAQICANVSAENCIVDENAKTITARECDSNQTCVETLYDVQTGEVSTKTNVSHLASTIGTYLTGIKLGKSRGYTRKYS